MTGVQTCALPILAQSSTPVVPEANGSELEATISSMLERITMLEAQMKTLMTTKDTALDPKPPVGEDGSLIG